MREHLADFVQHLSWAFYGQECGCEARIKFNWLARLIGHGTYDEEYDTPIGFSKITWWISDKLACLAHWLYDYR